MSFSRKIIEDFLDSHQSHYVGKYCYHSSYKTGESTYTNRYYIFDSNFRRIDIYVEIQCIDSIEYKFSEELHEQEQIYIVKDVLKRILYEMDYQSNLHYSLYETIVSNDLLEQQVLEPIDYCKLLFYMKYHQGINQKTMDEFYKKFIPCVKAQ